MLFKERIDVYSENHLKVVNTVCGQTAEILNLKAGGSTHVVTTVF